MKTDAFDPTRLYGIARATAQNSNPACHRWEKAWAVGGLLVAALLVGCAAPDRGPSPVLYDFGERAPSLAVAGSPSTATAAARPPLALSVHASAALDSPAMRYRLAYDDARQLRSYALARWAVPPADLVHQRLRETLSRQRTVLKPGQGGAQVLALELEEFSQVFEGASKSHGLLRLRATLQQASPNGMKTLAQRSVQVQRPAPTAGAAGGVRALEAATDAAVAELVQWLQTVGN